MIKERMVRAMLEPLVNKAIKDIKNDPERALRNTVDLALNFPVGRFSKKLFQITQKMLTDEKSAYYNLVKKIAADVDVENLKDFTVNIGYNSCTAGAKRLREKEAEMGFAIPWSISLYSSRTPDWSEYIEKIINQGNNLGIFLYPVFGGMAFDYKILDNIQGINNILISINGNEENLLTDAANMLCGYGRLFACHKYYSDENYAVLLENDFLKSLEKFTNSFVFYIPEIVCSTDAADEIKTKVIQIRDSQQYAFVLMDLKNDLYVIDGIISGGAYSIGFKSDGTLVTRDGIIDDKNCDIKSNSLVEILKALNEINNNKNQTN